MSEGNQIVWEQRADALNQAMIYVMNSKNKTAKKDLLLAYSQENHAAYPPNIKAAARYLSTQYPNNKPANQRKGNKRNKRTVDDTKSEDKDSNTGNTAGAHVEYTTTYENTTASSGGASLGAHVSETSQATSRVSRTVEELLGAYPVDDNFWDNNNPADVSINTVNSEEKMIESHITKFHTHQDEQPVIADLLCQED